MFAYQYCLSLGLFAGHSTFVLSTKLSKSLKKQYATLEVSKNIVMV